MNTLPLESPVMTSPVEEKARQVTYFGLSRASKIPVFLERRGVRRRRRSNRKVRRGWGITWRG